MAVLEALKQKNDEKAAASVKTKAPTASETLANLPLATPEFSAAKLKLEARNVVASDIIKFLGRFAAADDPEQVADAIIAASANRPSQAAGLRSYANGCTQAVAIGVATHFTVMRAWTMSTIQAAALATRIGEGVLVPHTRNFHVASLNQDETAYTFLIAGTGTWVLPEWHVHWGAQDAVVKSHFKNNATKPAHVDTDEKNAGVMKAALGDKWGYGK